MLHPSTSLHRCRLAFKGATSRLPLRENWFGTALVMADLRENAQTEGEWVGRVGRGRFGIGPVILRGWSTTEWPMYSRMFGCFWVSRFRSSKIRASLEMFETFLARTYKKNLDSHQTSTLVSQQVCRLSLSYQAGFQWPGQNPPSLKTLLLTVPATNIFCGLISRWTTTHWLLWRYLRALSKFTVTRFLSR